ncbi:MAG: acyl-CoA dehydrogenase family protein [Actinobacteria bacterium]|nr:acyl-CoA dehydrogenase family protein [Actinomycetota bacterium]
MIDFEIPAEVGALCGRIGEFVRDVAIPAEARDDGEHGLDDGLRRDLQAAARGAGVFAPQLARELGGQGLDMRGTTLALEAAGYGLLGPPALNCAAPDEGNMHLLDAVADPDQRERYLLPLAAGEVRSCFAMTEPSPGAGSDPSLLRSRAVRGDGGWVIDGQKWFITGAEGAAFAICMATTEEGATMFLVDADNPGWRIERLVDATDRVFAGGHAEVALEECRVGPEAVLGEVGKGFEYAQVRLAPARLTHCSRWLGAARRAHDFALERAAERPAFGGALADLGMVQERIARSEIDLATSRLLNWHCAWTLDQGGSGRAESSLAKAHVAEACWRVVDRSVQICGALGVSGDGPLARLMNEMRPFRIYDGPTETHLWAIARRAVRRRVGAGR